MTTVTKETNSVWLKRVELVEQLVAWVRPRLLDPKARKRADKAAQYVYGHLCLGKMLFSKPDLDPLFTIIDYPDEQMVEQIGELAYTAFREQLKKTYGDLCMFLHAPTRKTATWEMAVDGLSEASMKVLDRIKRELRVPKEFSGAGEREYIHQNMIGVVLRGKCIGAFDNNLHGSVKSRWGDIIGNYQECFASPFNHKFVHYYSMFEEDRAFGSLGNFFSMVDSNGGILPDGEYQMNPVWMNVAFEMIADILERSITHGANLICVIVAPHWDLSKFRLQFNKLMGHPMYKINSLTSDKTVNYVHDLSGKAFPAKTSYWILSYKKLGEGVADALL